MLMTVNADVTSLIVPAHLVCPGNGRKKDIVMWTGEDGAGSESI